jgi:hypothetical protein
VIESAVTEVGVGSIEGANGHLAPQCDADTLDMSGEREIGPPVGEQDGAERHATSLKSPS